LTKAVLSQSPEAVHEVTFAVAHSTVVPGRTPAVAVLLDSCKLIAAVAPVGVLTGGGAEEPPLEDTPLVEPPPDEVLPVEPPLEEPPLVVDEEPEPLPVVVLVPLPLVPLVPVPLVPLVPLVPVPLEPLVLVVLPPLPLLPLVLLPLAPLPLLPPHAATAIP
jgi:hypothetical protein